MGEILTKNCFPPQIEPHTDKLCFCVVFQHIWGNSQRSSRFSQNLLSQRGALKYTECLFFLTCLKRVDLEKNLDLFNQLFLTEPVKWGKY